LSPCAFVHVPSSAPSGPTSPAIAPVFVEEGAADADAGADADEGGGGGLGAAPPPDEEPPSHRSERTESSDTAAIPGILMGDRVSIVEGFGGRYGLDAPRARIGGATSFLSARSLRRGLPCRGVSLEVRDLSKRYGAHDALRGIDLTVAAGEIHGLLGRNGAGKTTLLRTLLGLVGADTGTVRLVGVAQGSPAGALPAGVAGFADTPKLYPYLSGRRNLELLSRLDDGASSIVRAERIITLLDQTGLTTEADRRTSGYSAGMRQRLGLAAALLRSPRLLLIDEPSTALDPAGARELQDALRRLSADGVAILLSSHDVAEVEALCRSVTVLHHGRVVFSGPLESLQARAPAAPHSIKTSDDAGACAIAEAASNIEVVSAEDGLALHANTEALDAYVLALGRAGIAVRSLTQPSSSLASTFLELTQGARPPSSSTRAATKVAASLGPIRIAGVRRVVVGELTKLAAQAKVWLVLAACVVGPIAFVLATGVPGNLPEDTLFGRWVRTSGFAAPLVLLGFAGLWLLPALTSVVAGDIFSSEDRHGTWAALLTRSRTRGEVVTGKVVTALGFAVVAVVLLASSGIAAGVLLVGSQPLLGLSGTLLPPAHALPAIVLAWLSMLPPTLAFGALAMLVSVATRSSVAGVGVPVLAGFAMQLYALIDGPALVRRGMLATAFGAWHGLLSDPPFYGPLVDGTVASAVYFAACMAGIYALLRRRDLGGMT